MANRNKQNTDIIAVYKITYENGFVQTKALIHDYTYQSYLQYVAMLYSFDLPAKEKDQKVKEAKDNFYRKYGDFFTTNSPLAGAIRTGQLVTVYTNQSVQFTKLVLF